MMAHSTGWVHDFDGMGVTLRVTSGDDAVIDLINKEYPKSKFRIQEALNSGEELPVLMLAFPLFKEKRKYKLVTFFYFKKDFPELGVSKGYLLYEAVGPAAKIKLMKQSFNQRMQLIAEHSNPSFFERYD